MFAINFVFGVVTGVPMEFQFGTNWARFSRFAGGVIGQTLAMEGMFAFFLESTFLGLFLFGEKRLCPRAHLVSALAVFLGSWLSGYFIVATDAWMQHPVGYTLAPDGAVQLASFWRRCCSIRWAFWQYLHTMGGAVVTGAFAVAGLGAYYLLRAQPRDDVRAVAFFGSASSPPRCGSLWQLFPSGDQQGRLVDRQSARHAGRDGGALRHPAGGAPLVLIGQPEHRRAPHRQHAGGPLACSASSPIAAGTRRSKASTRSPPRRPDNIGLLYYSYHLMVGLGTIFLALMALGALLALARPSLRQRAPLLWALMLAVPLPYIANTAGWMTAEIGRQPWLVYGLMRTAVRDFSPRVSAGNGLFSLLGFMGLYVAALDRLLSWSRDGDRGPRRSGRRTRSVRADAAGTGGP